MFLNLTESVGRIFLGSLFLNAGVSKLGEGYANTADYMEAMGVMPILLPLVIITEIVFAIGLIIGFKTRLSAILLAGFTLLALLYFHFDLAERMQQILFMKNIAIAGGLLVIAAHGSANWSVDNRLQQQS